MLCDLSLFTSSIYVLLQIFTISLQIPVPRALCKISSLQTALAPLFLSSIFLPFLSFWGPVTDHVPECSLNSDKTGILLACGVQLGIDVRSAVVLGGESKSDTSVIWRQEKRIKVEHKIYTFHDILLVI